MYDWFYDDEPTPTEGAKEEPKSKTAAKPPSATLTEADVTKIMEAIDFRMFDFGSMFGFDLNFGQDLKDTLTDAMMGGIPGLQVQQSEKGGLVGATNFPTITLPKMEEGGIVGMSPFPQRTTDALGLESGGLFTLSQGEFVLDNQAAQTFMKAAQLLTNSQALEQSRAGGGPPVVINQVDNSQANPVVSNQATQIKAPESPHARESTKAMLDQAYAMG